jgi:ERCC4-related helicase
VASQIGRIEVRTDESMDIARYVHHKSYDLLTIPLGDTLTSIRDRWAFLMTTYLKPLVAAKLIYEADPVYLSPYVCQMAYPKIKTLPGGPGPNGKFFPMVKVLGAMCRAMEYLIIQSVTSFMTTVKDLQADAPKTLVNNPQFSQIINEVGRLQNSPGYVGHPKMHQLRDMCMQHFRDHEGAVDQWGEPIDTRVMVFCNFRAVVEELVDCLNQQRPLIKATPFVGQSTAKGARGMSQKEQLEVSAAVSLVRLIQDSC